MGNYRKRCHTCTHRGDSFKIAGKTHLHCCHPDYKLEMNPWKTLSEFWHTCPKHEVFNQSPLNNSTMLKSINESVNFQCYVCAVEMASHLAKGDGEANKFDHAAKDFHREGYLEAMEAIPQWKKNVFRSYWEEKVKAFADTRYKD